MTVYPKPNTQPIYPNKVLTWRVKLTNQVTPNTAIPNTLQTNPPLKLGTAGESGALIWAIQGAMCDQPDANIVLYSRREGDTDITPRGVLSLQTVPGSGLGIAVAPLPLILPNNQKGLHLEANEELFVGLYINVYALPIIVYAIGGHY